jgi:two-component system chemotaxis response regulator CheB
VLIGGSAGAFDPLVELLAALPADCDVPVAVILHVPRQRPNALASALARTLSRPVADAEDKAPLAPGTVTIAPADYHLLIEAGAPPRVALDAGEPVNYSIPSIDVAFESAAAALGSRVAGVVLSGANADGAAGLAAIVAAGGAAFVQAPAGAVAAAMPEAALARCPSAIALDVSGLAAAVAAFARPGPRGSP